MTANRLPDRANHSGTKPFANYDEFAGLERWLSVLTWQVAALVEVQVLVGVPAVWMLMRVAVKGGPSAEPSDDARHRVRPSFYFGKMPGGPSAPAWMRGRCGSLDRVACRSGSSVYPRPRDVGRDHAGAEIDPGSAELDRDIPDRHRHVAIVEPIAAAPARAGSWP